MKRLISILLLLCLVILPVFAMQACKTETPAGDENGKDNGNAAETANTFKVGLECAYAPFNWTQLDNSNGAVKIEGTNEYAGGYDVEIAKKIAQGLGKELVIVKTDWDGLLPAVQSGVIDAIIAGMSPTAERKLEIDFSEPYYRSDLVMIVKKGSPYENAKSLEDFKDAKITAQLNTFHYSVIDQITGVKKQEAMSDFPTMRVALGSGVIDGYIGERPEGISVTAANKDFAMVTFEKGKGFKASDDDVAVAVGLKKGQQELVTKINNILAGISDADRTNLMDTAVKNQPASESEE